MAIVPCADILTLCAVKLPAVSSRDPVFWAFLPGVPFALFWCMNTAQRFLLSQPNPITNSEIASAHLARGEVAEADEEWGLALEHYGIGLSLLPKETPTLYFLFNNAAHCLNALELYSEGESYCRRAIEIDPTRPEAYKNLAAARRAQGNFRGSALCLVEAIKIDPSDERAVRLLNQLLMDYPTLSLQYPQIARELELLERR